MLNNGLEKLNDITYQTFIDDDYVYYFETETHTETEYTNNGDGDIPYELETIYLKSLEYRFNIETEVLESFNHQDIFELCEKIF